MKTYRSRYLAAQRTANQQLTEMFMRLAADIGRIIIHYAGADDQIQRSEADAIRRDVAFYVRRFFIGRGEQPLTILVNGRVSPESSYTQVIYAALAEVTRLEAERSAGILQKRLPNDLWQRLRRASINPFPVVRSMVQEQVFRPNVMAVYEPPHTWVDPNGYRLSDRVWNTSDDMRRRLDQYIDQGIREGRGALAMARGLEQFLIPGQARTKKPYGVDASFPAMRLARTEITRAHNEAARMSAAMNPFVTGMQWMLSASHPRVDICDAYARGGDNGDGIYSIETYPSVPHPHCLCYPAMVTLPAAETDRILNEIRGEIRSSRQDWIDLIGPALVEEFISLLLGDSFRMIPG